MSKGKTVTTENNIDFFNFSAMENRLPILEVLSERFIRQFRVNLSNHLRMLCNMSHSSKTVTFKEWTEENQLQHCMFIVRLNSLSAPVLFKIDRNLAYSIIDTLSGGGGRDFELSDEKEFTSIELNLLRSIGDMLIETLGEAWAPVHDIKAQYVRTEIRSKFIGIVPPDSKCVVVTNQIDYENGKGEIEIIYPYSTLFPVRDKLFSKFVTN